MDELKIFNNAEFGTVRTLEINSEPWFVGKDVAEILGYSNASKAVSTHVDEDDKQFIMFDIADSQNGNVPVGQSKTAVINESGLYSLILSSKLPKAKEFKRWVTAEVLPAIRKHGGYITPNKIEEIMNDPDAWIKMLTTLKEERLKNQTLALENAQQKQIIGELRPKADYTDTILNNKGLVTISQIAKDYGMSGRKLNALLHDLGVQYKQSGQWLLYSKYHNMGYTHSKTIDITRSDGSPDVTMETKWTQKGRLFIYDLLKKNGILPTIERDKTA